VTRRIQESAARADAAAALPITEPLPSVPDRAARLASAARSAWHKLALCTPSLPSYCRAPPATGRRPPPPPRGVDRDGDRGNRELEARGRAGEYRVVWAGEWGIG
jgi:hypothetical protein